MNQDPCSVEMSVEETATGGYRLREVANHSGGKVTYKAIAREFVVDEGIFQLCFVAANLVFSDPPATFPHGQPDNVKVEFDPKAPGVFALQTDNQSRPDPRDPQVVEFLIHHSEGSIDPTILNEPILTGVVMPRQIAGGRAMAGRAL